MTQLLSTAFDYTVAEATKLKSASGKARGAIILLVDEADALAQSREAAQMHHEDRAGVNAFIRGIDRIANARLPAAVLMCTNRLSALDPAVRRRAADVLSFVRPATSSAASCCRVGWSPSASAAITSMLWSRHRAAARRPRLWLHLLGSDPTAAADDRTGRLSDETVDGARAVEIARSYASDASISGWRRDGVRR